MGAVELISVRMRLVRDDGCTQFVGVRLTPAYRTRGKRTLTIWPLEHLTTREARHVSQAAHKAWRALERTKAPARKRY